MVKKGMKSFHVVIEWPCIPGKLLKRLPTSGFMNRCLRHDLIVVGMFSFVQDKKRLNALGRGSLSLM